MTPEIIEAAKRIVEYADKATRPAPPLTPTGDCVMVARAVAALSQPGEAAERDARVRAEAIEECAKLIDDYEKGMAGRLCCAGQRHHLASAIRALGEK